MNADRPTWTLTEAAKDCRRLNAQGQWSGVSRKTLQRALDKQKFPNAYRADGPAGVGTGPWLIPLADLIEAGFKPNAGRSQADDNTSTGQSGDAVPSSRPDELEELQTKLAELETDRADLLRRAEVAEAIAEERERNLDDVRAAMRMLEAGRPNVDSVASVASPEVRPDDGNATQAQSAPTTPRRRFLDRFTR